MAAPPGEAKDGEHQNRDPEQGMEGEQPILGEVVVLQARERVTNQELAGHEKKDSPMKDLGDGVVPASRRVVQAGLAEMIGEDVSGGWDDLAPIRFRRLRDRHEVGC